MKNDKTNVMRILDSKNIDYIPYYYDNTETNGCNVAKLVGKDENQVFKTLVTVGNDRNFYVFVIPVNQTLDLKKAAKSVKVKNIEMIAQKDLLKTTGYIHGGCSPIGMVKKYKTVFDETCILYDEICFSGGKVGAQVEVKTENAIELTEAEIADVIV